jgi:hypothetical protein
MQKVKRPALGATSSRTGRRLLSRPLPAVYAYHQPSTSRLLFLTTEVTSFPFTITLKALSPNPTHAKRKTKLLFRKMDYSTGKKRFTGMVSKTDSLYQEFYANDYQVVLRYRKNPVANTAPAAANSAPADQEMTDAPATANASNSAAPATSDQENEEMPDAPEGDAAGNNPHASKGASTMTDIHSVAAALSSRRTLRTRTVRQPEQANALPSPASQRTADRSAAIARRTGLLPPSERTERRQRGGIIELPYIADPRLQRAPSPTDSEVAAAHVSSPSLLGMPPVVFQRIAKYVLVYE